jgi:hypothetical protein
MSNIRYFGKSRIKIKPNKQYKVIINRKDCSYYTEIMEYADRIVQSIDSESNLSVKISINKYGKIKRHKSFLWSFVDNVKLENHLK